MMKTNLNVSPYYDDFNESKNFHKILFRPGYSVQARELTQLQTILQNQIERFGNHVFKHGSVVIPGNTNADLGVNYAKLNQVEGYSFADNMFKENDIIVGSINGVRAIVKTFANIDTEGPKTVYFSYISGGVVSGVANGINFFVPGEEIFSETNTNVRASIQTEQTSLGLGSIATIGAGVYYVNGHFVAVEKQTTVISRFNSTPTCRVVLKISESIITADSDNTLLDPSQGSYNYAAPGADRFTIDLTLEKYSYVDNTTDDYVELMRYNTGVLEEHTRFAKYSELEKSLAKRTFEESGNYRVSGFNLKTQEHLRTLITNGETPNGGLYVNGDASKFVLSVSPGRAYINGFGVDRVGPSNIILDKARTDLTTKQKDNVAVRPKLGQYIYVSDISGGLINFNSTPTINLYASSELGSQIIGSCKTTNIDFVYGSGTSKVYALGINQIQFSQGYIITDVGGFGVIGTSTAGKVCHKMEISNPTLDLEPGDIITYTPTSGTRSATVEVFDRSTLTVYVYRHSEAKIPVRGDYITAVSGSNSTVLSVTSIVGNKNTTSIVQLPYKNVKRVKNSSNQSENIYYVWSFVQIITDDTGAGSVSLNAGESIVSIEDGSFLALSNAGFLSNTLFSLNDSGGVINITGGPVVSNIGISCIVRKQNAQERTKTLTVAVPFDAIINKTTPKITLPHSDIFTVTKITLNSGESSVDITASCIIDGGQKDTSYELGTITYNNTFETDQYIRVEYSYFEHSSSGDYFSIDSYANSLGSKLYDKIGQYTSSTGEVYNLGDCLDFRKSGSNSAIPVTDYTITTSIQHFVGYYVLVYLDSLGVKNSIGAAADKPLVPKLPAGMLAIGSVYVAPYTKSVDDIVITEEKNYTYKMSDISVIERRVENLEYFSTLSDKETLAASYNIIDPSTGLNRFKTGLIVENFENQGISSNIFDANNTVSFLDQGITAAVTNDQNSISVLNNTASRGSFNTKFINQNAVSIDYDEVEWAQQNLSTTVENLNPFMVFKWKGIVKLTPDFDSFVETINLPEVFNNLSVTNVINIPVNAGGTGTVVPDPSRTPIPTPTPSKSTQSINFTTPTTKETGSTETLSAIASSGLPVKYTTSTPGYCTLADNILTMVSLVPTGSTATCKVSAHQAGDATWASATSITKNITIIGKTNVINFTAPSLLSRLVQTQTLTAISSSGLPVTYNTSTPGVCTVSGSTLSLVGNGSCIVTAVQGGNSEYPVAKSITRTITVTALPSNIISFYPSKTENQTSLVVDMSTPTTLLASASSALPVVLESLTPESCTVSGNILTPVAAPEYGSSTCLVTASQAGNENFAVATSVIRKFEIRRKSQTINFTTPASTKVMNSAPTTLVANASSNLSVVFESLYPDICTVSGNQLTAISPGECIISAKQPGNLNVAAAPVVPKRIKITAFIKTAQSITFTNPGSIVDGQTKTLEATASSGLPVVFTSATESFCTVSGSILTALEPGTCIITASQPGNSTFREVSTSQQFTITELVEQKVIELSIFGITGDGTSYSVGSYKSLHATTNTGRTPTITSNTASVCTISNITGAANLTEARVNFLTEGPCEIIATESGGVLPTYGDTVGFYVSKAVVLTKTQQTIILNKGTVNTKVGGSTNFTAIASSGLPIVYTTNNSAICSITNTSLSPAGLYLATLNNISEGTCILTATQAGNTTYDAVNKTDTSTISGVFKTKNTITFDNPGANQVVAGPSLPTFSVNGIPALSAYNSAGTAITFASSTPFVCHIGTGTTSSRFIGLKYVTEAGVSSHGGVCTIVASSPSTDTHEAAPPVEQSFNVVDDSLVSTESPTSTLTPATPTLNTDTCKFPTTQFYVGDYHTFAATRADNTGDVVISTGTSIICNFGPDSEPRQVQSGTPVSVIFRSPGTCMIYFKPAGTGVTSATALTLIKSAAEKPIYDVVVGGTPVVSPPYATLHAAVAQAAVVGASSGIVVKSNLTDIETELTLKSETPIICTVQKEITSWSLTLNSHGTCIITGTHRLWPSLKVLHTEEVFTKVSQTLTVS